MRLNRFIALSSDLSRRAADQAISDGRVTLNGALASVGDEVNDTDVVQLDGSQITVPKKLQVIMLNKPIGYVCSKNGQGSKTIYELIPSSLRHLNPVGRLDKNSSGLLLMTNDGKLAQELSHPSLNKLKHYVICLDKPLVNKHQKQLLNEGVVLEDGVSRFDDLDPIVAGLYDWEVVLHEGRNRQIRRTFRALGYRVTKLHREKIGPYELGKLPEGKFTIIPN